MLVFVIMISLISLVPVAANNKTIGNSTSTITASINSKNVLASTTTPITITKNSDFATYSTSGSGTKSNPYIIENYDISNCLDGVNIQGTNLYFILQNITVSQCTNGFQINNVINGQIVKSQAIGNQNDGFDISFVNNTILANNTASSNSIGFYSYDCYNNANISNNLAKSNSIQGFDLIRMQNSTLISNNATFNTFDGFYCDACNYTNFVNNTAFSNNNGFNLDISNSTLKYNRASNNTEGIYLFQSESNNLKNNSLYKNLIGLDVSLSSRNLIVNNTVVNNSHMGFSLDSSNNNTIENNFVINNAYSPLPGEIESDFRDNSNNNTIINNTFSIPVLDFTASLSSTAISLTWKAPVLNGAPSILFYEIYRGETYSSYSYAPVLIDNTSSLKYIDTNLTATTQYDYIIKTVNAIGVTMQTGIISVPFKLATTNNNNTSIPVPSTIKPSSRATPMSFTSILFAFGLLFFIRKRKQKK